VRRRVEEPGDTPAPPLPPPPLPPSAGQGLLAQPAPNQAAPNQPDAEHIDATQTHPVGHRAARREARRKAKGVAQGAAQRSRTKPSQRVAARLGLPERKPDPEPLETNEVRVLVVGTAAWLVAFVVLLPLYDRLMTAGRGWWLWTCLAGFGLGLWGIYLVRRRRAALARALPQTGRPDGAEDRAEDRAEDQVEDPMDGAMEDRRGRS